MHTVKTNASHTEGIQWKDRNLTPTRPGSEETIFLYIPIKSSYLYIHIHNPPDPWK